jgi:hypothetical protein
VSRGEQQFLFEKSGYQWRHAGMDEFDVRGHARLVGNVLIAVALIAFGIALAGLLPEEIFKLRPHFFGNEGAAYVGVVFLVTGLLLRR